MSTEHTLGGAVCGTLRTLISHVRQCPTKRVTNGTSANAGHSKSRDEREKRHFQAPINATPIHPSFHPAIALFLAACPKPSFVLGPKSSIPKVKMWTPLYGRSFLLSHPIPAPERLSGSGGWPELVLVTQLYLKGPGDLALLAYIVVLFSFLCLVPSYTLFPMLAQTWDREGGEGGAIWGAGVWDWYLLVVGIGG
ncbi:hypothetical protein B0H13DRAFT_1915297, partial [Mycena leptocephala]